MYQNEPYTNKKTGSPTSKILKSEISRLINRLKDLISVKDVQQSDSQSYEQILAGEFFKLLISIFSDQQDDIELVESFRAFADNVALALNQIDKNLGEKFKARIEAARELGCVDENANFPEVLEEFLSAIFDSLGVNIEPLVLFFPGLEGEYIGIIFIERHKSLAEADLRIITISHPELTGFILGTRRRIAVSHELESEFKKCRIWKKFNALLKGVGNINDNTDYGSICANGLRLSNDWAFVLSQHVEKGNLNFEDFRRLVAGAHSYLRKTLDRVGYKPDFNYFDRGERDFLNLETCASNTEEQIGYSSLRSLLKDPGFLNFLVFINGLVEFFNSLVSEWEDSVFSRYSSDELIARDILLRLQFVFTVVYGARSQDEYISECHYQFKSYFDQSSGD